MRTWSFDLEITRIAPEPIEQHLQGVDADEATAAVRAVADADGYILAAQRHGDEFGEDFHVWLAGGRALVRRDEQRQWDAADAASIHLAGDWWFRDPDGSRFSVQHAKTVSREQASNALAYWLRTGGMVPSLTWR